MIYLFWFLQTVIEEILRNVPLPLVEKIHAGEKATKINPTKEDTDLSVLTEPVMWSCNRYMKINWFSCPVQTIHMIPHNNTFQPH